MTEDLFGNEDEKFDKFGHEDKFDKMDYMRTEEVYTPPSQLKFSPEMKDRFKQHGFYLHWVYYDAQAIRKRTHPSEGYTFVKPEELKDEEKAMIGEVETYGNSEVVRNGDLVLMKVRIEKAEARRRYYQDKTKSQSEAINKQLRENSLDSQGSRSVVRTGKNAHFMN